MTKMLMHLPKPKGPYKVGVSHLSFIDSTRSNPYGLDNNEKREIPFLMWYPIDSNESSINEKFLPLELLRKVKKYIMYKCIPNKICKIDTNSHKDAQISRKFPNYPLLLFSCGFLSLMEQNYILMEHLASFGYIVVSIGHPYDGAVWYPDRRTKGVAKEAINSLMKVEDGDLSTKEIIKKMNKLEDPNISMDEVNSLTKEIWGMGKKIDENINYWIEDTQFVLNILEKINKGGIESQFKNKINFQLGIGAFGHSYGGATSIMTACLEERIKCAINMDGGMFNGLKQKFHYTKPLMFMESRGVFGMNRYFYNISENDTFYLNVKNSRHLDFSDLTMIYRSLILRLFKTFGKIDGTHMVEVICTYIKAFFDKYIKGIDNPILYSSPYSDVELKFRLKL